MAAKGLSSVPRESRIRMRLYVLMAFLFIAGFSRCQLDSPAVSEERYVTVRLNDSLKRYDSVEIAILVAGDTSNLVGKMWSGALSEPGAIPSYRLEPDEVRPLTIRVRGFDSTGALTLNMLISKDGIAQTVTDLPLPKPPFWVLGHEAWKHHRIVDIKANYVGFSNGVIIRDFPLLVRLTKDNFDFSQAGEGGRDIRFSTTDGKPIAFEISHWEANGSSGQADIWVALDSIRANDDSARMVLHCGNSAALDSSDATKVFQAEKGFSAAWHFNEAAKGDSGEFRDATGRYHGIGGSGNALNLTQQVPGVVGYGQEFRPGALLTDLLGINLRSFIAMPDDFDPGDSAWTFQAWMNRSGNKDGIIFEKGDAWAAGKQRFQIACIGGSANQIVIRRQGMEYSTNVNLPSTQFTQVSLTYDGSSIGIYVDGFLRENKTFRQGSNPIGKATFGTDNPDESEEGYKGIIDEPWFSNRVRSPEWLRFAFATQKPNSEIVLVRPPK